MPGLWVAELIISAKTAAKLNHAHHLSADEVRDALQTVAGLRFVWNVHPERGRRAYVEVDIRNQRHLAVLYPVEDPIGDVWALGSCYRI